MYAAQDGHVVKHLYNAKLQPLRVADSTNRASEGVKKVSKAILNGWLIWSCPTAVRERSVCPERPQVGCGGRG